MDTLYTFFNSVAGVLKTFRIADVLDIAILTYVIYKGIMIVKETRAQQLVKGLLLLGAVFLAAKLFKLGALEFLLKNLFSIGAIALIIVFQPELRRVLDKVGRTKVAIWECLISARSMWNGCITSGTGLFRKYAKRVSRFRRQKRARLLLSSARQSWASRSLPGFGWTPR